MISGRVIAMAALFSVAVALAGCATDNGGKDRNQVEYYTTEDTKDSEYHRNHAHYRLKLIDQNIAGFGSH